MSARSCSCVSFELAKSHFLLFRINTITRVNGLPLRGGKNLKAGKVILLLQYDEAELIFRGHIFITSKEFFLISLYIFYFTEN